MSRNLPAPQHVLSGALVALLAVLTLYYGGAAPPLAPAADWIYHVIEAGAAVACLLRAWRGPERGAWLALGLGTLSFAAGDLWFFLAFGSDEPSFPSVADVLFLLAYPAFYVAIVLFTRARLTRYPRAAWLDGLIGALALSTIGATLLIAPIMAGTGGDVSTIATNLVYPLGDLLLVGLLGLALLLTGWQRDVRWLLLAGGFLAFGATDSVFLIQTATGTYQHETLLDVGWPLALVCIGVAAGFSAPPQAHERESGWSAFAVPGLSGLFVLALVIRDHYEPVSGTALWLGALCLLAVLGRLLLALADNLDVAAQSEREAMTDPLTGLRNRRRLMIDLERVATGPPHVLALFDLDGFKGYNDTFGHPAGDDLLARLGERLETAVREGRAYRIGGDEFCVLAPCPDSSAEAIVARAADALSEAGPSFALRASHGTVLLPSEAADASEALQVVDRRMYADKAAARKDRGGQTAAALLRALHERRPDLADHDDGVGFLAGRVAVRLGLPAGEVAEVRVAAELHDIGKLAVPDAILDKPGPLDDDEWAVMRRHTEIGARIVSSDATLARVATMVRGSHERWAGGGYPDGISGEDIPLGARIICACDAWDAMMTSRPYRDALPMSEALAELRRCAGTQFDPAVVDALLDELSVGSERLVAA